VAFADYLALLRDIHAHLRPRTYVEVGVHEGDSLRLALPGTRAVGIDPVPPERALLAPGAAVLTGTSDEVFPGGELAALLDGRPVDLAFIDGMHQVEFALRDFMALERLSGPGSTVLVHDCSPLDAETSARDRRTVCWSGDVWKLLVALGQHRPDLRWVTVDVPPTGLAVVRGLDPGSTVLSERYEAICRQLVPLGYDAVARDKPRVLRLVPAEWDTVVAALEG
jgi:hypothetical protein